MQYCSECGLFFNDQALSCSSCGYEFTTDSKEELNAVGSLSPVEKKVEVLPEQVEPELKAEPINVTADVQIVETEAGLGEDSESEDNLTPDEVGIQPVEILEKQAENVVWQPETGFSRAEEESQLGKGIIKPQAVEVSPDGFHFKYDTPPPRVVKVDSLRGNLAEYRVTSSDELPEANGDKASADSLLPPEAISGDKEIARAVAEMGLEGNEAGQDISDNVAKTEEPFDVSYAEAGPEAENLAPLDSAEPESIEPELKLDAETTGVIWEGVQTWFGIPGNKIYRISNDAVEIMNQQGKAVLEVGWANINEVKLAQSWLSKLFGRGDLIITTKNAICPKVVLAGIPRPEKILVMLEDLLQSKV